MKIRGFELVSNYKWRFTAQGRRLTAGYDLKVAEPVIAPGRLKLVRLVSRPMQAGEVLYLCDRSSNPRKRAEVWLIMGSLMATTMAILKRRSIFAQMKNITDRKSSLKLENVWFRLSLYPLIADGDEADGVRTGGLDRQEIEWKNGRLFISCRYAVRLCCCRKSIW